ncbi:MAG: hypothetical protein ACFFCP_06750 [Promethearchaeota archaeon]
MSKRHLIVDAWIRSNEARKGFLKVENEDVVISFETGEILYGTSVTSNIMYSIADDKNSPQLKIQLAPVLVTSHFYAANIGQVSEDIFPLSSGGFYGRLRAGNERAVFIVQRIQNSSRSWLIIADPVTGEIYETQIVQRYEVEALKLEDDQDTFELWDSHYWSDKEKVMKDEWLSILNKPSPSWMMISKLLEDTSYTTVTRGSTIKDTLTQLVPDSFPEDIRDQLMAFLASVMMENVGMREIVDLSSPIYAAPIYSALLQGHLRCKIDNVKWPPYLELIQRASKGQLEKPKRALPDLIGDSWSLLIKIFEEFPSWFGDAINSAQELNSTSKFRPRLPVTKSNALRSRKLWKKRLATITYGLRVRGHVNPKSIGLTELVYIGAAYRWPHRHMRFITRLGMTSENPAHLQVMTMPLSGVERVTRVLPQSIKIDWSCRVVNLGLYDQKSEKWSVSVDRILESVNSRSTKRRIIRRFGSDANSDTYQITSDEAKVLGLVSHSIKLESFELPHYFDYWNLSRKQVSSIITNLQQKRILQLTYEVDDARLVSLATIFQGKEECISALVDSLLTNSPTSLAMVDERFGRGVVISKFPENIAYDFAGRLNQLGLKEDLAIRCMRPRTFRGFTYTLYDRLLKPDGTWDDDVTAFLSQARSKRRELSESNA